MFRWDPEQYGQFATPRARPFGDLVARIGADAPRRVLDLGCGPGELTATLAQRWPQADIVGIDSSPEMLAQAQTFTGPRLRFRLGDVTDEPGDPDADVVLSNALFQWVPEHVAIFQRWVQKLRPTSWFAFQVPGNFSAPSHVLMRDLVVDPRWRSLLPEDVLRHEDAALDPGRYAAVFLDQGWSVDAWETTYLHLLSGPDPVLEWVRGTGLRPVLSALPTDQVAAFEAEYAARLREAYPTRADGLTPFAFRRVFCVAHGPSA